MININKQLRLITAILFLISAYCFSVQCEFIKKTYRTQHLKNKIEKINQEKTSNENYKDTLTFTMINYDENHKISDSITSEKARNNVSFLFNKVKETCSSLNNTDYLWCAHKLSRKYFYYSSSKETSNNYAKQQADCDLYSYIMYDIAEMKGIDAYVVYSPGHAFFSWRGKDGFMHYMETTSHSDKVADFKNSLYKKTLEKTYYHPIKKSEIFKTYQALVYEITPKKLKDKNLAKLTGNIFESNNYLYDKYKQKKLTIKDVQFMEQSIKTDITSNGKKIILADWYINHHNHKSALKYLNMIDNKECTKLCTDVLKKSDKLRSILYHFFNYYDKFMSDKNNSVSILDYIYFLLFIISTTLLTLTLTGIKIIKHCKRKT